MHPVPQSQRTCLREPIAEIATAAHCLEAAVQAHLQSQPQTAAALIRQADMPAIREWTESLWGSRSPYVQYRPIANAPPSLPKDQRVKLRMPSAAEKRQLHLRDGFHCRFCGIPLVRKEVRDRIRKAYPDALSWGSTNSTQHAAFQAMWLQYDHLLPHARGGGNELDNLVLTCAPCNFARMNWTLEEVGLSDPRSRPPVQSSWTGLEAFI